MCRQRPGIRQLGGVQTFGSQNNYQTLAYSFKGGRISLNYFVEQFMPQGIVESTRAISWQLEELNSWAPSGKEGVLPKSLLSQDDWAYPKLHFLQKQHQRREGRWMESKLH